jgi:hypothetical protein
LRTRFSKVPSTIRYPLLGEAAGTLVRASPAKLSFGSFETRVPRDEYFVCSESKIVFNTALCAPGYNTSHLSETLVHAAPKLTSADSLG